ncbi:MAG: O-antigen ligase family protein [Candidatus Staskawiczbacteria bacterium]|jgi:O-antigen ligase/Flp pilus assembly protein TadD
MKINSIGDKLYWAYIIGFFVILALPLLDLYPWFLPPDWGKTLVFRSVMAIILFLFAYQFLYRKQELSIPNIKKNKIVWALVALFVVYLISSIFSVDPYFSFWGSPVRSGGFFNFAFYIVFAILTFILFKKEDWKKSWIFSLAIGILICFLAIIQFYSLFSKIFISFPGISGPPSTMGNPIFLAIYLLLLFLPTLSFAIKEKNKYLKIFYIFSLLLFGYTILITGVRAAYFGIVAGILYFLFFYPKKFKIFKILTAALLLLVIFVVFYINAFPNSPKVLQKNLAFKMLSSQLSIKQVFNNERFRAWQTVIKEIENKPILGWGPENLSVGFDKNYSSLITKSPWWDRAHNIFLDVGAETGILGMITYLALFVVLFWQLQKSKQKQPNGYPDENKKIIINGIQATLVGYLVANFFSFDSFSSYFIFFLLIGYSLHLTTQNNTQNGTQMNAEQKSTSWKPVFMLMFFCILVIFMWQYNFVPLQINEQLNIAGSLAYNKNCKNAVPTLDNLLPRHSILDSFVRLQYIYFTQECASYSPEQNLAYATRDAEIANQAVKIQPLDTILWIFLGHFTTIMAKSEQNAQTKTDLLNQAYSYFDKATSLAPKHQEILIERAKTDIAAKNYQALLQDAQKCVALNPNFGECYWDKALFEIYSKDFTDAENYKKMALQKGFITYNTPAISDLAEAYIAIEDYRDLSLIYENLISANPKVPQYHSALAAIYGKMGEYQKAREQAMIYLQLVPDAKDEVNAFLKTLPY